MLPQIQKSITSQLLSSHIKIYQHTCLDLCWTGFKWYLICAYFSPDSDQITFFTGESDIMDKSGLKLKMSWFIYFINKQAVCHWCLYQPFELLFWRHPFPAVDPLVSKWCDAKFLQFKNDLIDCTSWMAWGWIHLQQLSLLGEVFL